MLVKSRLSGRQILAVPTYSVILTSRDDLPIQTVVQRHRARAGHENVFKGPLREMDLHHPPCRRLLSNQAGYALAQIAQLILIGAKYQLLPQAVREVGLRNLIRNWIRCSGRIIRKGRYWFLQLSQKVWPKQWPQHAIRMLERGPSSPI